MSQTSPLSDQFLSLSNQWVSLSLRSMSLSLKDWFFTLSFAQINVSLLVGLSLLMDLSLFATSLHGGCGSDGQLGIVVSHGVGLLIAWFWSQWVLVFWI